MYLYSIEERAVPSLSFLHVSQPVSVVVSVGFLSAGTRDSVIHTLHHAHLLLD